MYIHWGSSKLVNSSSTRLPSSFTMKRVPEPILLNDRKKRRPLVQGGGGGGGESEVRLESERQGVWKAKGKGGQGGGGGAGESEVRLGDWIAVLQKAKGRAGATTKGKGGHGGGGGAGVYEVHLGVWISLLQKAKGKGGATIMDHIYSFLATSPCAQANGIACCNRATNIAWRRMFYPLTCKWLQWIMSYLHSPNFHPAELMLMLADLADVLGM